MQTKYSVLSFCPPKTVVQVQEAVAPSSSAPAPPFRYDRSHRKNLHSRDGQEQNRQKSSLRHRHLRIPQCLRI